MIILKQLGLMIIVFTISCLIFGCEFVEKDGIRYFQWGFYHYKKKHCTRL